jgi:mannose-1-phosphate guanylyltransferase
LLQQAFDRLEPVAPPERLWVITSEQYVEETAQQLPGLKRDHIIGEPVGRDTGPCIGLGAALIGQNDPNAVMVVTPADHIIQPDEEFHRAIHTAQETANVHPSALIAFGVAPTYPATGYGYIRRGNAVDQLGDIPVYRIREFKEKPDRDTALSFLASGEYYWNSGIFVWKTETILAALRQNKPELHGAIERIAGAWKTPQRDTVLGREYQALERISIDYAVMERTTEALVIQAPYRWDDVGSWLAIERLHTQDAHGNTIVGEHCGLKTENCVIVGEPGHLVATIGLRNLLIVQSGDAILIADRRDEATVKDLVERLKQEGREAYL